MNKNSTKWLQLLVPFIALIGFNGLIFAGDLEPTAPPAPTMHTLDEIFNKLDQLVPDGANLAPVEKTGQTATVVKTGQTATVAAGDDGDLENGVTWPSPRFTDNADGTVTDNLTKLIWMKDARAFGFQTWNNALNSCNLLADGQAGLTDGSVAGDWWLPNVKELSSLIHYGVFSPSVPNTAGTGKWTPGNPFNRVQPSNYWSSTTLASNTTNAWIVNFSIGNVGRNGKASNTFVWCARGGV